MNQTPKRIVAVLTVLAMLLSLAACGAGNNLMKGIFEKLNANEAYAQWKAGFNATTIEESLNGNTLTVTATGEEGINGTYLFTLDGDYIINESEPGQYTAYSFMMYLLNAVADYYGMNSTLMKAYLAGLESFEMENTFFTTEEADGKTRMKLYAASAWNMQGLDEMYINDRALSYTGALTQEDQNSFVNAGKISMAAFGNKESLSLVIGEFGENTDLTLKSLQNAVAKLQPNGCEAFAKDYTELKEVTGNGYSVSFGLSSVVAQSSGYSEVDGYSYVTAMFFDEPDSKGEDGLQNPVMNLVGSYSADRCTIEIMASGKTDATISVHWGNSATEAAEYTMSGTFDPDTLRINYSDGVKKNVVYDEDGNVFEETTEYENGIGRIQFYNDGTLAWQDEQEADSLAGMTFTYILP